VIHHLCIINYTVELCVFEEFCALLIAWCFTWDFLS